MAKKPQKTAPEPTDDEAGEGGPAKPAAGSGRKRLVIVAALGAIAVSGAGGYWFLGRAPKPSPDAQAAAAKAVAFLDIREMIVNLAPEPNQERGRFLKFRVALEVSDAKTIPSIQPFLPRVEDAFQVFVRELRATDLEGSAGLYRLREELLRRVNVAVYPAKVEAVLFKDIVVQ